VKKILEGHVAKLGICATVAAAVSALEITTKRTLPKECTQRMTLDNLLSYASEEFEA
jgi:hypothetical protein